MASRRTVHGPPLRIELCDGLRISAGAAVLDRRALGQREETALALLAVNANRTVRRTDLAGALWGEELPDTWPASLRNVLSRIRRLLEPLAGTDLVTVGEGRMLAVEVPFTIDLDELEESLRHAREATAERDHRGALERASATLARCTGPVLPALTGEWADGLRSRAESARRELHRCAAEAALRLGEPALARRMAEAIVEAEPLDEPGHRLLIRALDASGDRAGALQHYETLRRQLRETLGITPSRDTEDLFLELLRNDEAEVWRQARRHRPFAASRLLMQERSSAMIGRKQALGAFEERLERARTGRPQVLTVSGPAGIGKTRFAASASTRADEIGLLVLYGRADDRIPIPYGPIVEGLNSYMALLRPPEIMELADQHLGVLARLVPAIGSVATPSESTGNLHLDRLHATQALIHLTRALAAGQGLLLVLDDLHWAGENVSAFISGLLAETSPAPIVVLALHRPTEDLGAQLDADPEQSASLGLEPLTPEEVRRIVGDQAPGEQDGELAESIWATSAGNPYLVKMLLHGHGHLPRGDADPSAWEKVLAARVAALSEPGADLLKVAAVTGEEFDPEVVIQAASMDSGAGERALADAERAGLLEEALTRPGWRSFSHDLVRASVLDQLADAEEAALHTRIADALEEVADLESRGEHVTSALAYHLSSSSRPGDWRRAVAYALPVMGAALVAGEFDDVVALGLRTLSMLDAAGDPQPSARWQLSILIGSAWRALGDDRAHGTLLAVVDETRTAGEHLLMTDAALALVDRGTGTAEAYLEGTLIPLYEELLGLLGEEEAARRARLLGHLATAHAWTLDGGRAAALGQQALELAEAVGDPLTSISVLSATRQSMAGSARVAEMAHAEEELLRHARIAADPVAMFRVGVWRFETLMQQGHGADLEAWLARAERELPVLRDTRSQHQYLYSAAACALLRGEVARADELAEEAAEVGRSNPAAVPMVEGIRLAQLLGIRYEQGRLGEIRNELVAWSAGAGIQEWVGTVAFIDGEIGRAEDARAELDLFFGGFDRTGPTMAAPIGLAAMMASTIRLVGDVDRARSFYEVLLPYRGLGSYFVSFGGPFDHALGILAASFADRERARAHFEDAISFGTGVGAPLWTARSRSELDLLG